MMVFKMMFMFIITCVTFLCVLNRAPAQGFRSRRGGDPKETGRLYAQHRPPEIERGDHGPSVQSGVRQRGRSEEVLPEAEGRYGVRRERDD